MTAPIDLYELLPAVHRREDAGLGYPLRALLDIVSTQVGHVQRNITDLWDDFFIETAADWVIPYLADLVGTTPLHEVAGSWRADVASTIGYRRRKGTVSMLEALAADVTGWGARVVVCSELLGWTQHLDHLRRQPGSSPGRSVRVGSTDVGDTDGLDLLDGPFDRIAHSVDVRPFGEGRGRHNLRKIGFFLWRLQSYPLVDVDPHRNEDHPHGYHLHPLGNDAALFTSSDTPLGADRPGETDLPGPVRRLALHTDLQEAAAVGSDASRYYGPESHHSLAVAIGDPETAFRARVVPAPDVCVCDLQTWRRPPDGKLVAVDPVRGRLTLSTAAEPGPRQVVRVSVGFGFSGGVGGDVGGGPYDRRASLDLATTGDHYATVASAQPEAPPAVPRHATITAAVDAWLSQPEPAARAIIEVLDSATYVESDVLVALPAGRTLELRARSGERPVLQLEAIEARGAGDGRLILNGFAIAGGPLRVGAGLSGLVVRHCTLVPGRSFTPEGVAAAAGAASIVAAEGAGGCQLTVSSSILGPLGVPAEGFRMTAIDSIIDAGPEGAAIAGPHGAEGPACDLRRVTVLGGVHVRSLSYASDVLFDGEVRCERTQVGCVRFSWVPPGSTTPRRYRCQPDLAAANADLATRQRAQSRLRPRFTSRDYGQPGYAQLAPGAAPELQTGGADGSQIGAFSRLREPQREANLRLRLDEYLPAGLDAGLIYVT